MPKIELLTNYLFSPLLTLALLIACLVGLNLLFLRIQKAHPERILHRQAVMLLATLMAFFLLIIFLPISDSLRGQILSLLGILLSATIALSATTFLGNALAGILLRSVRSFRSGDFIYINEYFGRVSGRGMFHIEIQTADRDLLTLPNLYVTNNPVKVVRASGTVVTSEVSLGYDVPRTRIEPLLLEAATAADLEEPFVHILQLGDFSVVYRVSGLLADTKLLLSARSRLNGAILDTLHAAGIEIVSPNFMNTRNVADQAFIATEVETVSAYPESREPEEIIFDKAEQAETIEQQKACQEEISQNIAEWEKELAYADDNRKGMLEEKIARLKRQHALLSDKIEQAQLDIEADKKGS